MDSKSSSTDLTETSQSIDKSGDGVLCEQEYETQYFGFTPKSFCDGVYNAVIEYVYDDLELVQKYIKQEFHDLMSEELLRKASEDTLLTFIKSFDKAFDKLEVYLMSNILHIPNNVILPEDSIHTTQSFTEEDEDKVDTEITELRQKIKYTKYLNACLKRELLETDKITTEYEALLKRLQTLEKVICESGVIELKESLMFTVSKAKKLQEIVRALPPITAKRANSSAEEKMKTLAKRIKPETLLKRIKPN